jgi:hypothetical protein
LRVLKAVWFALGGDDGFAVFAVTHDVDAPPAK